MKTLTNIILTLIFATSLHTAKGQLSVLPGDDSYIIKSAKEFISEYNEIPTFFNIINFGSFIDAETNELNVVAKSDILYTKAELINKGNNKLEKSFDLTPDTKMINLSNIPAATYLLILTNDEGEISVEELTVMK